MEAQYQYENLSFERVSNTLKQELGILPHF